MTSLCSLKKSSQFRLVYGRGRSVANKLLVMYAHPNKEGCNRLGLSVSKKVGKSVVRNRVRRLIKESYRNIGKDGIKQGYDIVIIARLPAAEATYAEIFRSLSALLGKHCLINAD